MCLQVFGRDGNSMKSQGRIDHIDRPVQRDRSFVAVDFYFGHDPITAPLFGSLDGPALDPPQPGGAGVAPPSTTDPTPAPSSEPSAVPCPLLSALLGVC